MKRNIFAFALLAGFVFLLCGCREEAPASTPPATVAIPTEPSVSTIPTQPIAPIQTVILREVEDALRIDYTLMAISPDAPFTDLSGNPAEDISINTAGADALLAFLKSQQAKEIIEIFGVAEYGSNLYYVNQDSASESKIPPATEKTGTIRLSAPRALCDSGLMAQLLGVFEEAYGYTVELKADETFLILSGARHGDADLVITSTKAMEEQFESEGFARFSGQFAARRVPFAHSYYVLCGPAGDPAGTAHCGSIRDAFAAIAEGGHTFISRGDGFTLHAREAGLWPADLGITTDLSSAEPHSQWYISAGMGSGPCLVMAEETGGYVLTDKLTYLVYYCNNGFLQTGEIPSFLQG